MSVKCPNVTQSNVTFDCSIDLNTNGEYFPILIDFADNSTKLINSSTNSSFLISKIFDRPTVYNVTFTNLKNNLQLSVKIYGFF